jgi:hypothetical protein
MNVKDDRKTDASHDLHMNDRLGDLNLDDDHHDDLVDHRMNVKGDRNLDGNRVIRNYVRHDLMTDESLGVNLCHRMNDLLGDHLMVVSHVNRSCVRRDLKMGVNLYRRMNDQLDDHSMDDGLMTVVNLYRRMNVMDDPSLGVKMDVSRDLRRNDRLDDHSMEDDHRDVPVDHHMSGMGDRKTDVNLLNRSYAPRDLKMDGNSDVKNLHVRLMVYLNMNCDRMSHDHLRYDRQMMLHRDMNRKVGMNLDGKLTIHHDCRPKKDVRTHLNHASHLMMVCLKKI